jgi:DNA-binding response OmpR family regulator
MEASKLAGRVILLLEDEPLVGLEIADTLGACGAHVVSACRVADAITSVDRHQISAAVLDIKLGGDDCALLCEHLLQRQIPFVFYSGYAKAPDGWNNVPIISKPARGSQIVDAVERLCRSHQQAAQPMRAKRLIESASYGPDALKIVCQAFDEAWESIAGNFGNDPVTIEAARLKLVNIILSFPHNWITDTEQIKRSSLQIMALQHRGHSIALSEGGE